MKREEFVQWAESRGWKMDRWGHLQKAIERTEGIRKYRYKLSRISVRFEVDSGSGWVRIKSGFFSKLSISPDGKLIGLTR